MAETIKINPASVTDDDRVELDITPWIRSEGVDWGDASMEAYTAINQVGESVVDHRLPNRQVTVPLIAQSNSTTSFTQFRQLIQAEAARIQSEGGKLSRVTSDGSTAFTDITQGGLTLGGGWFQAHRDADPDAELRLQTVPEWYGAEVTGGTSTGTGEVIFTESTISGNLPARSAIVVTNTSTGTNYLGVKYGIRARHHSTEGSAALVFEAEDLDPLDTASTSASTSASGGGGVLHSDLGSDWTPVMGMDGGGSTAPTHVGTYRLEARLRSTNGGDDVDVRVIYGVGDDVNVRENDPVTLPGADDFYALDLGELRIDEAEVGTHRWQGAIQARGADGGESIFVDKIRLWPTDEGYGVVRGKRATELGLSSYSARDDFQHDTGSDLTGTAAAVGGTWAGAGDAADFSIAGGGGSISRTATSDTGDVPGGRLVTLDVNETDTLVSVQFEIDSGDTGVSDMGVLARYVDANNFFWATYQNSGTPRVTVGKYIGGLTLTSIATHVLPAALGINETREIMLVVVDNRYEVYWRIPGAAWELKLSGADSDLASGGTLASGDKGIVDHHSSGNAATRTYRQFQGWVPDTNAVVVAGQTIEVSWDGVWRETSGGGNYSKVPIEGKLPRLPVSGDEGRTVEIMAAVSEGDFDTLPDTGLNEVSAFTRHRPSWMYVPE